MRKIIIYLAFLCSLSAFAGVMNGGGGKGIVCWNSSGKISSVELLDIWESKVIFQQNPDQSIANHGVEAGVNSLLEKLKNAYPWESSSEICQNQECVLQTLQRESMYFLSPNSKTLRLRGVSLELTNDSYESARPNDFNCQIEQIVNYQKGGKILINQDLYEKLDLVNQIALIAHESFYSMLRFLGKETSSIRTRRTIGYVLGGNNFIVNEPTIPGDHILCKSGEPLAQNLVYLYPKRDPSGRFVGAMVYPKWYDGSRLIGLPDPAFKFDIDEKNYSYLLNGKCNADGMLMSGLFTFDGPVEFDQFLQMIWICKDGALKAFMNDRKSGLNEVAAPLDCKIESN